MWVRRVEFVLMQPVGAYWRHAHPRTAALIHQYKDFGESNREAYSNAQRWLDGELADGRAFIAGDNISMADICALSTVDFANWIGLPTRRRAHSPDRLARPHEGAAERRRLSRRGSAPPTDEP